MSYRPLRIVNNDYESRYKERLARSNCFSIQDQNIHRLATEIREVANDLSVRDLKNMFKDKINV